MVHITNDIWKSKGVERASLWQGIKAQVEAVYSSYRKANLFITDDGQIVAALKVIQMKMSMGSLQGIGDRHILNIGIAEWERKVTKYQTVSGSKLQEQKQD